MHSIMCMPILIKLTFQGLSYFIRMLGPALGYTLASMCLKLYISPSLKPTITNLDPRWLGAWWLGWLILGAIMTLSSFLIAMFPKTLPRAQVRRVIQQERIRRELSIVQPKEEEASLRGMLTKLFNVLNISANYIFSRYVRNVQTFAAQRDAHVEQHFVVVLFLWLHSLLDIHAKIHWNDVSTIGVCFEFGNWHNCSGIFCHRRSLIRVHYIKI